MTNTNLLNAVAIGGNGYGTNPTKTTLQAGTSAFSVGIKLTNGANAGDPGRRTRIYVACIPFSAPTAAAAVDTTKFDAYVFDIVANEKPNSDQYSKLPLLPRTGDTVYTWLEESSLGGTITTQLYEIN